jgi:hypothetical protein
LAELASMGLGVLLSGVALMVVWEAAKDLRWLVRQARPGPNGLARSNGV